MAERVILGPNALSPFITTDEIFYGCADQLETKHSNISGSERADEAERIGPNETHPARYV